MKTPCIISFLWLIFLPTAKVFAKKTNPTVNRTLSASLLSINRTTGEVIINGVDTRGPSTPFTWFWGDGTSNNGFFPQTKTYADVNRSYVVKVISNYPNNEKDSVEVVVNFTALNLSGFAVSGIQQVEQTLISTQTIPPNTNVTYQAGNSISLQGTFSAQAGSVFKAEIKR